MRTTRNYDSELCGFQYLRRVRTRTPCDGFGPDLVGKGFDVIAVGFGESSGLPEHEDDGPAEVDR